MSELNFPASPVENQEHTHAGVLWKFIGGAWSAQSSTAIADVQGLETALDDKLNVSDVVNNLTSTETQKALSAAQGKVLQDTIDAINVLLASDTGTLDTLQEVVDYIVANRGTLESLGIANISGLQAALDGKAASSHTHTTANITGLDTALAGKQATLTLGTNVLAALAVAAVGTAGGFLRATAPVMSGPTFNGGPIEQVFAVSSSTNPALSPNNGPLQTWTLTAARTPTLGTWAEGQSMTLHITAGAYTVDWGSLVTWKTDGGAAPDLLASGVTPVVLWKVGSTVYGIRAGDA